jgi:hypothetical protein
MIKKICTKCNIEKDICGFQKDKTKNDGHYSSCKECKLTYRRENKVLVNVSAKRLRDLKKEINPELFHFKNNERSKKYYNHNKKEIYFKKSKKLSYRLNNAVRGRIRNFLKSINTKKNNKTFNIVGCSPEYLKEHLENKFIDGMSWDNYGKWHIDHIIPLSSADSEDGTYKLCHYSNLQPLWARDNLKKGNKKPLTMEGF